MKDMDRWRSTKFVATPDGWRASTDPAEVSVGSRLISDMLARHYHASISTYARGAILDHGCGKAPLYGMYSPLCDAVTCVDWESSLHDVSHADRFCDLNERLPFDDEAFDTVLSSDVVEHLWNPVQVMADLARVLRPGGHLIIGTPFYYWIHEAPHDYFRWSPYALRKLGEMAGLKVVELTSFGGPREVLADVTLKVIARKSRTAAKITDDLLRTAGFVSVERTGDQHFPLGTVTILHKA